MTEPLVVEARPVVRPIPPCGHIDRQTQLTEMDVPTVRGNIFQLLVCTVEDCPEYLRAYVDLRDEEEPEAEPDEEAGPESG